MIDCKDIKLCTLELMKSIKRRKPINKMDEGKIVMLMNIYIDKLIFNIASLCALLCLKMGVKQILNNHMNYLIHYINKYCNSSRITGNSTTVIVSIKGSNGQQQNKLSRGGMKGGAFNTAAFFGVDESKHYKIENAGKDVMNCDFNNNIARPALGLQMTGGACLKLNKIVKLKIKKVFKHFNIKVGDKSLEIIMVKFNDILNDLTKKLGNSRSTELKFSNFKKLIYKTKIMKNDI